MISAEITLSNSEFKSQKLTIELHHKIAKLDSINF